MPRARYKQLVERFTAEIRSGQLSPGTRLPTHRQLAAEEGIALATASRVYAELETLGLVSGETGRGTFVREIHLPASHGIDQPATPEGMLDLNFNSPSLPGQAELLRQGLRELAAAGNLESLLHYQPHAGRQHERAAIARHLRCRGLSVEAEQILIVNGAQHGLATAVMAQLNPGDLVAVDALIYPGFKVLAEVHKLELVPIAVTEEGPDLAALEKLCQQRKVKAIYSMPTLHNPLGWVLSLSQRQRLVDIARQHELLIIEDAAYAFHANNPPPPLAVLAPERTLYISGLSKSIATGLRVGFIAAPEAMVPSLERIIRATSWNTPALMTALACRWLEDGTIARLEQQKRDDASARQQIARRVLKGMDFSGHSAAYFLWLRLPEEVRADQVVSTLLNSGISISTADPYATTEHVPHALRLALASVPMEQLESTLMTVREVIEFYAC